MTSLHVLYATAGVLAVVLALTSRRLRDLPLSEPLLGLLLGVALGPVALGVVDLAPPVRDVLLLEGARLLLAGSVMAAALRFPVGELRPLAGRVAVLLLVAMPLAAALAGATALALGLPLALAMVVGACLCPTDPVLAASVVTGRPAERDLPGRLRRLLTAESGANDGLALPLVGLAVAAVVPASSGVDLLGRLAWEVVGAGLAGAVVGLLAAWGLRVATRHGDLEPGPELVLTVLLAVATLGVARSIGTDGVLAVFVAGLVYSSRVDDRERIAQDDVDEAINRYATIPLFVVLGAVLPWQDWVAFGPAALVFAVLVLVLRRPPVLLALARPLGWSWREATFLGWFGPMGVSAIFYLAHSADAGVRDPRVFAAGTLAVTASVVAAAATSAPARRRYARS